MLALVPSALGESSSNLDSISVGQAVTNVEDIFTAGRVIETSNGIFLIGESLSKHVKDILGSVGSSETPVVSISDIGEVGLQWGQVNFSQAEASLKGAAKMNSKFHGTIKAVRQDVVEKAFHGIGRDLAYDLASNFDVLPIGVINGVMNQIPNSTAVLINKAKGHFSAPGGTFGMEPDEELHHIGDQAPPGSINFPGVATPEDFPSESGFAGVPGHSGGVFTNEPSEMLNADPPGFKHANANALTHSNAPDALAGNVPNGFQGEG